MPKLVRLGSLRFVSIYDALSESLGDSLETVGAAVVAGERRARSFEFELPVHGDKTAGDVDERDAGYVLRSQVRQLMENALAKNQGLYFEFESDPELDGWLLVGSGELTYNGARSLTAGDWKLHLGDAFRVATPRTHRDARRLEIYDRRAASYPLDFRKTIYGGGFTLHTPLAAHYLPPGSYDVMGLSERPLLPSVRYSASGALGILTGRTHLETVHYEQNPIARRSGDVRLWDRRGRLAPPTVPLRTNWAVNPGLEYDAAGWTTGGTNEIQPSTAVARHGKGALRASYGNNLSMAINVLPAMTGATNAAISVYVWIPTSWDGGAISVSHETTFANATTVGSTAADMTKRDQWQRIDLRLAPLGADKTGAVHVRAASAPTAGRHILVDSLLVEDATTVLDYFDGDSEFGGYLARLGTGGAPDFAPGAAITKRPSIDYPDPWLDWGWARIMGPEHAFEGSDAPVLENGVCRVRVVPVSAAGRWALALDSFIESVGWAEQGRLTFYRVGGQENYDRFVGGSVLEWTPERGVIRISMTTTSAASGAVGSRGEAIITLQRGWTGPKVEFYPRDVGSTLVGSEIAFVWNNASTTQGWVAQGAPNASAMVISKDDPSVNWNVVYRTFTGGEEPWAFFDQPADTAGVLRGLTIAPDLTRYQSIVQNSASTHSYNSAGRAHVAIRDPSSGTVGYLGFRMGLGAPGYLVEAEAWDNSGSATSTVVADAAGAGGNIIEETQAAATADTLSITLNTIAVGREGSGALFDGGKYGIWARVRVVTGGATISIRASNLTGTTTTAVTSTSTTYVWLYLGELSLRDAADQTVDLKIRAWRSAGTGNVRIDRIALVPSERRASNTGALLTDYRSYDGARDLGLASLYDCRQIPELVER